MPPDLFDRVFDAVDEDLLQRIESAGAVAERNRGQLALITTRAQQVRNDDGTQVLFQDFESEAAVQLHPGSGEESAHGAGRTPLLANHLT